jgi:class 3 adenylate cyclase
MAPFSPALAQWELVQRGADELQRPSAWEFDAALLFVDISGFTRLCTRLDIDVLQRHINCYFGEMIDVVTSYGGDVLRFAGDALYCAWSLRSGAMEAGTLTLATHAACRCALELTRRCGTYPIPEVACQRPSHAAVCAGPRLRCGSAHAAL